MELRVINEKPKFTIAVTGATGFVGSHIARAFLSEEHQLVVIARGKTKNEAHLLTHPNSTFHPIDIGENSLAQALEGVQIVIHCAGINKEHGTQTYDRVHVDGTQNMINAALQNGVKHVVMLSYLGVRPDHPNPYHASKWEAEERLRKSGLSYTILRSGMNYGRGDHFLNHLSRAMQTFPLIPLVGNGESRIRPVAIGDFVKVVKGCLVGAGLQGTYSVVGPDEFTLEEMIFEVGDVLGKKPKYFQLPVFLFRALSWLFEKIMKIPIVSRAQVELLAEGMSVAASPCRELPKELLPQKRFDPERIQRGLSKRRPLGLSYCLMCIAKGGKRRTGRCPAKDHESDLAFEQAVKDAQTDKPE